MSEESGELSWKKETHATPEQHGQEIQEKNIREPSIRNSPATNSKMEKARGKEKGLYRQKPDPQKPTDEGTSRREGARSQDRRDAVSSDQAPC